MPAPSPLMQTPPARLDWSRPDTPAASDFGDIYFSTDGGLEETRTVFLGGCGLPDRWAGREVFTLAELGFGSGLNFLAAWQMWHETAQVGQRLHFASVEKFPFDATQLRRALDAWPELAELSEALIARWPGRVKGVHRLDFGDVSLTLVHDDVGAALDALPNLRADAWFLDGFSPSKNEAMWSAEVLAKIGARSAAGARAATFSVAGAVRSGLTNAGFTVEKQPGYGRKRQRLEATFTGEPTPIGETIAKALIIGAGIAGRSLAHALSKRGIDFDIINNGQPAASGNAAALIKPRFDLQDRPESRFFLSAYLYALQIYETQPDAIMSRGVTQIPKNDAQVKRFEKLAAQAPLGDGTFIWADGQLNIPHALTIAPDRVFANCEVEMTDAETALARGTYSHVFLAAGYGIRELAPDLVMRYSRGQLTWAQTEDGPTHPVAYGGYALPMNGAVLVGATHDRLNDGDPFELRTEDDAANLENYAAITGQSLIPDSRPSRASIRVTSADTLPVIAKLNDNRWALTGLGSRGFVFAPLLAEALIAKICGEVLPIEKAVWDKFQPR